MATVGDKSTGAIGDKTNRNDPKVVNKRVVKADLSATDDDPKRYESVP